MDAKLLLDIFKTSLLARRFEARVIQMAMAGEIPSTLHAGAGQEVCQTAAIAAMNKDDYILYGHRGVAYMIARGTSLAAILADIAGKEGATSRGKGGVMHVVDVPHGILGESGTLGGGFVISVGVGMALKRRYPGRVVTYFFGDGTSNRGTFHESLNWAAVQKLPCVYFCENNGYAVSVPTSTSTAVPDISARAAGYGVPGVVVDGSDAAAVYEVVQKAVERARAGHGPTLIEAKVTRLFGHYVGDQQTYRPDAATVVTSKDPLPKLQQALVSAGVLNEALLAEIEADARRRIEGAVATVKAAPLLAPEVALQDLYA
ncbi:MAG TPA: thiamine pyrophosphate-dependent dehydrogenase E1 component subunit alpha [Candidatus Binatia bacterium]|nr:thiamine pyrophosphate-dependent dehydrogenase E1 component subunit alpha [Candidatus Binatia bacterium]